MSAASQRPAVHRARSDAAAAFGLSHRGFPGLEPEYVAVSADKLRSFPYRHVGQVRSFDASGQTRAVGTGWRWSGGLVVTAAHVLFGAIGAECAFVDGSKARWGDASDLHPEFLDENGFARIGSPQDIAVMPLGGARSGGLDLVLHAEPGSVLSIGFPGTGETMVEHTGKVWHSGHYYGHATHTQAGHSGAPLLSDGKAVGLHVGVIGLVRRWQPDQPIQERDGANAAIVFDRSLLDFLQSRLR